MLLTGVLNKASVYPICKTFHVMYVFNQDKALQLALQVLQLFKAAEIDDCVKNLDQSSIDVLMKYIYRGFEVPSEGSSAILLTWFEKVTVYIS